MRIGDRLFNAVFLNLLLGDPQTAGAGREQKKVDRIEQHCCDGTQSAPPLPQLFKRLPAQVPGDDAGGVWWRRGAGAPAAGKGPEDQHRALLLLLLPLPAAAARQQVVPLIRHLTGWLHTIPSGYQGTQTKMGPAAFHVNYTVLVVYQDTYPGVF